MGRNKSYIEYIEEMADKKKAQEENTLPFCTRCFNVGIEYGNNGVNFCHVCGSEGTCVPMERQYIKDLQKNIDVRIDQAIEYGKEQGRNER